MATDYIFPTSEELQEIAQDKLPALLAQRPIFDFFPLRDVDDAVVAWEQLDRYTGLQQLRGINGAPQNVKKTAGKRFLMEPGVYGEYSLIDENELKRRRQYGTFNQPVNIEDLVMVEQDKLLQRRLDRIESILWTLATTGTFSIANGTGVVHTDAFNLQTFSATVTWATAATSTPLLDFRNVQLKARGHSVRFDSTATAVMNRKTMINLLGNTNNADLYGRRTAGLGTFNSPAQINELFAGDDLPKLVVWDQGYLTEDDSAGTDTYDTVKMDFTPFIADNKVVVFGERPAGVPVGEYLMTRNANNPGLAPGAYMKVIDRGVDTVPRSIEVHDGHDGGPAIYYPSAIVVMSV